MTSDTKRFQHTPIALPWSDPNMPSPPLRYCSFPSSLLFVFKNTADSFLECSVLWSNICRCIIAFSGPGRKSWLCIITSSVVWWQQSFILAKWSRHEQMKGHIWKSFETIKCYPDAKHFYLNLCDFFELRIYCVKGFYCFFLFNLSQKK